MRKYFVTGFYLLIIGGILLLGGIVMGANRSVVWDHGFKVAQVKDETYPLSDFKNIYVESRDTNVNIKFGDRYKIHVSGDKSQTPTYKVKNNTLTVNGGAKKGRIGVDVLGHEDVTITIPMNKKLDNVNIRAANGNVRISDVTIENLIKTAKDMDYDSNMYITDATVNNVPKLNLYNAVLNLKNTKINNISLVSTEKSNINVSNATVSNASFNLDDSELNIKQSNLDSVKSMSNHSKVYLSKSTLMNYNKFHLYSKGSFHGKELTVDGVNLKSTDKGLVQYFDKNYGDNYQNKADSSNSLEVKSTNGSITIK
ncbi:DUF4097 family beta strand repeat-containing protein [Companilactobacillus nuruki]|uniref:DUF4097 domain-containing protein n=1 Tax=Companilactobacillus nuruki TaxID=1993540 RepID=A0A2N7AS30_9LACO|nr:DUF4097 family beta strand repeat-containing protein [Companilactobacillus nuruki]PMD68152.1 hypothetical protein CBP76_11165 [Companilactobacillus nuruki]